jgi:hypothetical protein
MVESLNKPDDEAGRQAEARAHVLMLEFHTHMEECTALHPEHAGKERQMFEAWAIQKIAGLQLCVEHLSEQLDSHIRGSNRT